MKFFETLNMGKTKQDDLSDGGGREAAPSHIAEIVSKLDDDDLTRSEFDETVRADYGADDFEDDADDDEAVVNASDELDETRDEEDDTQEEDFESSLPSMSARMSDFRAFAQINDEMDDQLRLVSEKILLSKRTWALMKPYVEQFELDIRRSDIIEDQSEKAALEIAALKKDQERTKNDLSTRVGELSAATARIAELRRDVEKQRQAALDAKGENERLRAEAVKSASRLTHLRAEVALLTAQLERETVAKENAEQAKHDLYANHAKLQQVEAQTRNRAIEISLQNEKLMAKLPSMVTEHEDLSSQINALSREKGELQNRLMSAQDTISQLQSENRALEGQSASEAFSARTELEVSQAEARTALQTNSETGLRLKEAQAQLRAIEDWRQSAEYEIAALERDLDKANREQGDSMARLSDLNVKYMADLLTLDQVREQNKQFHLSVEALQTENRRLAKFESLHKASEDQNSILRTRIQLMSGNADDESEEDDDVESAKDDVKMPSAAHIAADKKH